MPRVHNFFWNYANNPMNFVKKTMPSKKEYTIFFREIMWKNQFSQAVKKEIARFKKEIKFNYFANVFSLAFSFLISICIVFAAIGIFKGNVTSENGIIILSSIGSFLAFFVISLLIKFIIALITYRTFLKRGKEHELLGNLLVKYLNNVQYLVNSKSPYTDFNFRLPRTPGRSYVNGLKFDLIPRDFSIGLYKDELFPSNKDESWFYRKTNIWLTTLYYLAYVIENGNPYEKDDQTLFEIPGWMSEVKWKEMKLKAEEYIESYLKSGDSK